MKQKILKAGFFTIALAIILSLVLFATENMRIKRKNIDKRLKNAIIYLENNITSDNAISEFEKIHSLEPELRITWLKNDGTVKYDSEVPANQMPNHIDRPEIKQALKDNVGSAVRHSKTIGVEYRYLAYKTPATDIIRISAKVENPLYALKNSISIIIMILLFTSGLVFWLFSRMLKKNFNQLENAVAKINNYDDIEPNNVASELSSLFRIIKMQRKELADYARYMQLRMNTIEKILSGISDGVVIVDSYNKIMMINKAAQNMLSVSPHISLIGNSVESLSHNSKFINILKSKDEERINLELDNRHIEVMLGATDIAGRIIFLVDRSAQYEAEKIRREFSANVNHELKTPLTCINGYAEMIAEGMVKDEEIKDFATTILNEGKTLLNIIDETIKLSKIEETAHETKTKVRIDKIGENIKQILNPQAISRHIQISLSIKPVTIISTDKMIHELLLNLVENAIRYSNDYGNVKCYISEAQNNGVDIVVSDDGIGMSDEIKSRIFERFYVGDTSRNKNGRTGTGLGLSIVKHIVMRHHGTIDVESKLNAGTTFKVHLPYDSLN